MSTAVSALDPTGQADQSTERGRLRAIMSACAGNMVEWFDFFVYAYTSIYFAASFFPAGDQTSQLLSTAAVFAVGFFMRPLGGWLFGWIADTRAERFDDPLGSDDVAGSSLIAMLPSYQLSALQHQPC